MKSKSLYYTRTLEHIAVYYGILRYTEVYWGIQCGILKCACTWILEVECHHLYPTGPHRHGVVVGGVDSSPPGIGPHQLPLCARQHLCNRGNMFGRGCEAGNRNKWTIKSIESVHSHLYCLYGRYTKQAPLGESLQCRMAVTSPNENISLTVVWRWRFQLHGLMDTARQ